jgi:hypothetical protein
MARCIKEVKFDMRNLVRKFFYGFIVAAALFGLGYSLWLYALRLIDGLQAPFSMEMSMLAILWFGFMLSEAADDWPLSIQPGERVPRPQTEQHSDGQLYERKAA